jgi:pyruvate-formate lyase
MARVLELTLFGGRDPLTGEQIGLPTPALDQMSDFAQLEAAYDAQLAHLIGTMVRGCNMVDAVHAEVLPSPFLSLVIDDCIERGVDVTAGGARYNFSGVQGVQIANVADSLAAVRQAVFEEKWLTAGGLLSVLQSDYCGQEHVRQRLLNEIPKYGNDEDRVDDLASKWADRYSERVAQHTNVRGGAYQPGFYTVSAHMPMGKFASNGTLLNMKFSPGFFEGEGALQRFVALLQSFCALRIPHVQFNVVSAETLRRAQEAPDEYRHLVVRVAGYSAYFCELDRDLQNEIICRTAYANVETVGCSSPW